MQIKNDLALICAGSYTKAGKNGRLHESARFAGILLQLLG